VTVDDPYPSAQEPASALAEPAEHEDASTPEDERQELLEGDPAKSPTTGWSPWFAPIALFLGVALALVAGLIVDIPAALAFGVKITSEPPGLTILNTVVQDLAFIGAAVYCAHLGGRAVRSWQFGLRRPGVGWRSAGWMIGLLLLAFLILSVAWSEAFTPEKEQLLKQLGSNEGAALLIGSAALTCVVAPICEEFLFRGFMFTALREWHGTLTGALLDGILFGAVHIGSAPALDLVPLAGLGFGLCLLYRHTGSLYPGILVHSLNNSVAFSSLEGWGWQAPILIVASAVVILLIALVCESAGLIGAPLLARSDP
jgi:membrane protease YdiL (CAAX protease family)